MPGTGYVAGTWSSIFSSSDRGQAARRPRSRPPSSASGWRSPSARSGSAASPSTPARSPPRPCARRCSTLLAQRPLDVLDPTRIEESEQQVLEQLMDRTARVVAAETAVVREQFRRNRVGWLPGEARFEDENTVKMGHEDEPIHARRIIIACGTRPARPTSVQFDDKTVIDSDGLLKLEHHVPRSMIVVGAGVIGVEYASMFGALGTKVTVVDKRDRVLNFLDSEIGEAFQYLLRRQNVTFRLREQVAGVDLDADGARPDGAARVRQGAGRRDRAVRGRPPGRHRAPAARERPAWRPTRAGASRSTSATAPPCRTSSPSATWPAAGWRRPRWSRAGSPHCTPSASRCRRCPSWSRPASTPCRRSRWSARPRSS